MTINEIKLALAATDLCGQAPLIEGLHGVGKSDAIRQYAKENNLHCEILILSLMDTSDILGLPRAAVIGGQSTTIWSAPDWFNRIVDKAWGLNLDTDDLQFTDIEFKSLVLKTHPHNLSRGELNDLYCVYTNTPNDGLKLHTQSLVNWTKAQRSVLFLDEFNRAPADTLNASLQLILDKRLHSHILPIVNGNSTFVVAAINPSDTGDYTTNELDPALLDRFVHFKAEADLKSWLEWARTNNVAPVIRDFLSEHPNRIHYTSKDGKSSATPRSWASLSRTMLNIDKIPQEVHFPIMKGCIGQELASQFLAYFNNYFKVIKMDDIEAFIAKQSKRTKDPKKLGEAVNKLIKDQEVIQKQELAEQFYSKYASIDATKSPADALPLIAFLEGLDLEILNGFLKSKKDSDVNTYMNVGKLNEALDTDHKKSLFLKIVSKLSK